MSNLEESKPSSLLKKKLNCFFRTTGLCTYLSSSNKTLSQNQKFFLKHHIHSFSYSLFLSVTISIFFFLEKSSLSLMLNTITFNTSCKPKLLHWRGTRATKCPTISLNKHANVCVGPPSNLPRVSALFSVVELACFFWKPQLEAEQPAQVLRGGQVSTMDSAAVLSSSRATLKSKKFPPYPVFPLCCVVVMNEGTPHMQVLHAHQNAVPCLLHQIILHPTGRPCASVHLL